MKKVFIAITAVFAGIVATLITALFNTTPTDLVGATWHGFPIAWFYVIVYPGSPTNVSWTNFLADVIFWSIIAVLALLLISRIGRKETPPA